MAGLVPGALIGGKQAASLQREVSRWRMNAAPAKPISTSSRG